MGKAKIESTVLDYKSILENIPAESKTKELLGIMGEAFRKTLENLLPTKYFAIYWEGDFWEIAIFNSVKALHTWEKNIKQLIDDWDGVNLTGEKISYSIITFTDFDKLANGKHSDLNRYRLGLDNSAPICFSPFYT